MHAQRTGVASLVVPDDLAARDALAALLWYLPDHHLDDPPRLAHRRPATARATAPRPCVPGRPTASYDVRVVVEDVLDADSFLELRPRYAPNLVTGYGSLGGRAVGIVANQPEQRAGTLDIEASRKAARFVATCDVFNVPIITFVDTPGFEPGRDLEWRGMIRHGAELVHAYSAATVPRICVVLRKAYGGAYIVMDSRGLGNDLCVAWPGAEIAVMGAAGAVAILNKGRDATPDSSTEYRDAFENPYRAAERGLVDAVIDPAPDPARARRRARRAGRTSATRGRRGATQHTALSGDPRTMLLADKRILVTGVLNDASMAFHVARRAQEEGAEVVLTSFGRAMSLTQRAARRLPSRTGDRRARRHRRRAPRRARRRPSAGTSTACCTRSASRRNRVSAADSSPRRGTTSRSRSGECVLAEGARRRVPAADGDAAAASSASTSTTAGSRGRSTTGWASPKPPSSRPRATSPAISAPTASA